MKYDFICKYCKREFVYPNDNWEFENHKCLEDDGFIEGEK